MAVKFGVFVPQGWRLDLVEIRDPVEQSEAMTAVARAADAHPAWDSIWIYDHAPLQQLAEEVISQFA